MKFALGKGTSMVGRLLLFNALDMKFRELKLRRDPACPICGDHSTIKELIDYDPSAASNPRPPYRRRRQPNLTWKIDF